MTKRIFLPSNTIIIIPNDGEIKKENSSFGWGAHKTENGKRVILKSPFKGLPDVELPGYDDSNPLHFIDHPDRPDEIEKEEPQYYPIKQQELKEEVGLLISFLRATDDLKTEEILKRIIDKVI